MWDELSWESLKSRQTKVQLTLLYKNNTVDIPAFSYLTPASTWTRSNHSKKLWPWWQNDVIKNCYLQVQFIPMHHPCLECTVSISCWGSQLGIFQVGALHSLILSIFRGQVVSKTWWWFKLCWLGDHNQGPPQWWDWFKLTLVLLNPDIPCLCKQYRSRSVAVLQLALYGGAARPSCPFLPPLCPA